MSPPDRRLDRGMQGTMPRRPVTILQIGGGNFLRGFFDWMVDIANERGLYDGGIAVAQTVGHDLAHRLAEQDMLYTVLVRGTQDGREIDERRIVSSISDAFSTTDGWTRALGYAASPSLGILVSNTTESGIVDIEEPAPVDAASPVQAPSSFPAKLASLLHARFRALGAAPGTGLLVIPCELIERNGETLKRIVANHARRWNLEPAFLDWLDAEIHFVDTLVDRIVPGYPAGDIERQQARWGYRDPLAVAAEPFHLLVIQGDPALERRLPLREAGLDVVWTDDLEPYRVRKVRILNGAHSATALAAFLAGIDTVKQMTEDPQFGPFLRRVLDHEIVPYVPLDDAQRSSYARRVLERFANPHIRHELISISLNSTAKWKVRILPSIKDAVASGNDVPDGLAFSLAALIRFERRDAPDGGGLRAGAPYPIRDDAQALAAINDAWQRHGSDIPALVCNILGRTSIWGEDLNRIADLGGRTAAHLARIEQQGIRAALAAF